MEEGAGTALDAAAAAAAVAAAAAIAGLGIPGRGIESAETEEVDVEVDGLSLTMAESSVAGCSHSMGRHRCSPSMQDWTGWGWMDRVGVEGKMKVP